MLGSDSLMSQVTPVLLHLAEILVMTLIQNVKMLVLDGIHNAELNLDVGMVHGLLLDAGVLWMALHL